MTYKILSKRRLAYKMTLFEVEAPEIAAKAQPGQFSDRHRENGRGEGAPDHL